MFFPHFLSNSSPNYVKPLLFHFICILVAGLTDTTYLLLKEKHKKYFVGGFIIYVRKLKKDECDMGLIQTKQM